MLLQGEAAAIHILLHGEAAVIHIAFGLRSACGERPALWMAHGSTFVTNAGQGAASNRLRYGVGSRGAAFPLTSGGA